MQRSIVIAPFVLMIVLALTACGNTQPTATTAAQAEPSPARPFPTATALSTRTPIPPTRTPIPPTRTPVPTATPESKPTNTANDEAGGNAAIRSALEQLAGVETFRMDADVSVTGAPPELMMNMNVTPGQPVSLLHIAGAFDGQDMHMTVGGFMAAFFGADADKGLETIVSDGQSYIRGPVPLLGAPEERWYIAEQSQATLAELPTDPDAFFNDFENGDLDGFNFIKTGSEALDSQQCDVYMLEQEAILKAIQELDNETASGSMKPEQIDTAEAKVWICADGYFHKAQITITGYTAEMPDQQVGVSVLLHMYDFNGDIAITAPGDAVPLAEPAFDASPFDFGVTLPGTLTATVFNGGNIRQDPSLQGQVLGQLHAGQAVLLHEKTADGRWYRVTAPEASGWVSVTLLTIDPATASQVPVEGQAQPTSSDATGLTAMVFNGGNVRAAPSLQGQVRDQIHAYETVQLLAKTTDGTWYKIINARNVTGWVNVSLLTIEPEMTNRVPVE